MMMSYRLRAGLVARVEIATCVVLVGLCVYFWPADWSSLVDTAPALPLVEIDLTPGWSIQN